MTEITNPILPGFNPDPSICRVGDSFYIATSTFQWYPGVQVWHSRNLKDWTLRTRPLNEERLLRLEGVQSSGGIWAPCLSYSESDSLFYLVYTVVLSWRGETPVDFGVFKDTPNYVVTAASIDGPWSDPVYLNSSGFDPSLFHDDDGRSWLVNMEWDYRGDPSYFSGILLQEYDRDKKQLVGDIKKIFTGTSLDRTEAPHLYKRNGWYYLMTAEGGTSYEHAVTLARSKKIDGPYEVHPENPLLHSFEDRKRDLPLLMQGLSDPTKKTAMPAGFYMRPQRAGHGSICPLTDTEWALVHLSGRPLKDTTSCTRGRETSIQRIVWRSDDWPYVLNKQDQISSLAETLVAFSWEGVPSPRENFSFVDRFDQASGIHHHFRFLRRDPGADMQLRSDESKLRLFGRESMVSVHRQTYVAVSVPFENYQVIVELDFHPDSFQQMAGLLVHYDERNQYYLRISYDDKTQTRRLGIVQFIGGKLVLPLKEEIILDGGSCKLALDVQGSKGRFLWAQAGEALRAIPLDLDMSLLADEGTWPEGFTGTFVGMACHDQTGRRQYADFLLFSFQEAIN